MELKKKDMLKLEKTIKVASKYYQKKETKYSEDKIHMIAWI